MKKRVIGLLLVLTLVLVGCGSDVPITSLATVNGNVLGSEDSKVRVEIYSDYDCPYCALAEETVYDLVEYFGDQIRFEFKDFVVHQSALKAAEAANCAADQNKFWEYHDLLFKNQYKNSQVELRDYAVQTGLEMSEFDYCLLNDIKKEEIMKDMKEGQKLGIEGTPTFVVNGKLMPGANLESLKQAVYQELNN